MRIQPAEFSTVNGLGFLEGCVVKRVSRHRSKGGAEDIRKAIHELELILEYEYGETPKVWRLTERPAASARRRFVSSVVMGDTAGAAACRVMMRWPDWSSVSPPIATDACPNDSISANASDRLIDASSPHSNH